jgi:hypothetical protein
MLLPPALRRDRPIVLLTLFMLFVTTSLAGAQAQATTGIIRGVISESGGAHLLIADLLR